MIKHHYRHCHDHHWHHLCHHRCHDDCRRTSFVARSAKQSIGSWELCRRHQQVCNFVLILILTLILIIIFILTIEIQSESGDISRNYLLSSQLTQKIWTQQPNTLEASFRQIAKTMFQTLFEWISFNTSLKFVFCLSETSQWFWRDFSKTMKKLIDQKTKVPWKTIKCNLFQVKERVSELSLFYLFSLLVFSNSHVYSHGQWSYCLHCALNQAFLQIYFNSESTMNFALWTF